MSRRAFALAALACSLLLAGCGVNHHDIVASTVISTPTNAEVPGGQTSPADTKAIKNVTVAMAPEKSQKALATYGNPDFDQLIASTPKEVPLDAKALVTAFSTWDRDIGSGKAK